MICPPPAVTEKTTLAPATGSRWSSRTMTEGGTGTASPSGALCTIGETGVMVAGPGAAAVALKVTGLPVMPAPATVAVRVLLPGTRPRVQESAVARPLASVVCEAPETRPPPAVTAKTTTAPAKGCWLASRTMTEGAAATACPTSAVWVVAVTASMEAGPGKVAVAVKVTGLPVIPLPAMEAVTTLGPGWNPASMRWRWPHHLRPWSGSPRQWCRSPASPRR